MLLPIEVERQYRRYIAAIGIGFSYLLNEPPENCTPDPLEASLEELINWQSGFEDLDNPYLNAAREFDIDGWFASEVAHLTNPEDRAERLQDLRADLAAFDARSTAKWSLTGTNIPPQPTEFSPQDRMHYGAIEGFKSLPHHHWYDWDTTYGYTLCGETIAKRGEDIGTGQFTLSISNGPDCMACRQRMNELLAAYDDARRD